MANDYSKLSSVIPFYTFGPRIAELKGKPVKLRLTLKDVAATMANKPIGCEELHYEFPLNNKPLTHLSVILETLVGLVEELFEGADVTMKDTGGYYYRQFKSMTENLNQYLNENDSYTLADLKAILKSLPSEQIVATLID